jgi:Zn-dependent protease with chaperone function
MDFFQAQDRARRQTELLVLLFAAAMLAIATGLFVAISLLLRFLAAEHAFTPQTFLLVLGGTLVFIGSGSAYRTAQLRAGGPMVAGMLGGRAVIPETADEAELRLRNVVEEMAIASGLPVPYVYVLPREYGINAFAAGWTPHDAAIAVTRGALEHLTRAELQAVIAHEISHILNGDMRLNIRMIGLVFGILQLAVLGHAAMRSSGRSRTGRPQAELSVPVGGILLVVIGYIGVFFGNLIRAAVSRQREFLADAAAAQFTRDPHALAGALRKIGGLLGGSWIDDYHAQEARHLFFAESIRGSLLGVFATHPPLEQRIRRLDPAWDGQFAVLRPVPAAERPHVPLPELLRTLPPEAGSVVLAHLAMRAQQPADRTPPLEIRQAARANVAAVLASIGTSSAAHVEHAAASIAALPDDVRAATRRTDDAQALLFALLIRATEPHATAAQRELVVAYGGAALAARTAALERALARMGDPPRLLLLDLLAPALRLLPGARVPAFLSTARRLIVADGQVHAFEYALMHILARQLGPARSRPAGRASFHSLTPLGAELATIVSCIAWTGAADERAATIAFAAGALRLPPSLKRFALLPRTAADLPRMDAALRKLERAAPGVRRRALDAAAHAAAGDGLIGQEQAEQLRGIAECLDLPVPPVIAAVVPVAAQ